MRRQLQTSRLQRKATCPVKATDRKIIHLGYCYRPKSRRGAAAAGEQYEGEQPGYEQRGRARRMVRLKKAAISMECSVGQRPSQRYLSMNDTTRSPRRTEKYVEGVVEEVRTRKCHWESVSDCASRPQAPFTLTAETFLSSTRKAPTSSAAHRAKWSGPQYASQIRLLARKI
jgi:hypothetical protein